MRVTNADEGKPAEFIPVRLIASSSTGGWLTREAYREYLDPVTGQTMQYCSLKGDQICILDPYPTSSVLQLKRTNARRVGSTYAPDFLGLMEVALINSWQAYSGTPPPGLFAFEELILDKDGSLKKTTRFPGTNKVGMLAWHTVMKTPQYPEGREVVVIANDVTVQSGSFGVAEDDFFFKASEYARERGIPRVFIACNSGARIGLVDELKPKFKVDHDFLLLFLLLLFLVHTCIVYAYIVVSHSFTSTHSLPYHCHYHYHYHYHYKLQVAWKDESNPSLGFDYLYLSEEDYSALPKVL